MLQTYTVYRPARSILVGTHSRNITFLCHWDVSDKAHRKEVHHTLSCVTYPELKATEGACFIPHMVKQTFF